MLEYQRATVSASAKIKIYPNAQIIVANAELGHSVNAKKPPHDEALARRIYQSAKQ